MSGTTNAWAVPDAWLATLPASVFIELHALNSLTISAIQYAADPSRNIAHIAKRCPGFLNSRFNIQQATNATATRSRKLRNTLAKCKQTSEVMYLKTHGQMILRKPFYWI
jgi:hypothetical protein